MMGTLIELAGWTGAVLILLAYLAVSTHRTRPESRAYQWTNILGAAGIMLNSWWNGALPSVGLNLVWMVIGFYSLYRASRRRQSQAD